MKLNEFHYDLPAEFIAQEPLKERDMARLMVLDRVKGAITERIFRDITDYVREGDCLVLNDTRVIPARLYGRRKPGGLLFLCPLSHTHLTPASWAVSF